MEAHSTSDQVVKLCKEIVKSDGFKKVSADIPIFMKEMEGAIKSGKADAVIEPAKKFVSSGGFYGVTDDAMKLACQLEDALKAMKVIK